jgi:hypothetical protein
MSRTMLAMQLDRSRTALRQATQAVEELKGAKDSPELFRDKFVSTMGMVQRVGSLIAEETSGHRTGEFGEWWKQTQREPLFVFMRDVRNAEFKRGESRQAAHVQVTFSDFASAQDFFSYQVIRDSEVIQEGRSQPSEPAARPSAAPLIPHTVDWFFSGGGLYDGHEVLSVVDRYLTWLRENVLPTAERLTT